MIKRLIGLLSVVIVLGGCSGLKHLDVEGHLNGNIVWTKAQSPYLLTNGDVYLDGGSTLTIEPGVTVDFMGNNYLIVDGKINAIGTASDPIIFKPLNMRIAAMRGIRIVGHDPNIISTLKYIRISNADFGAYLDKANVLITNSIFSSCGEGVHLWNSSGVVQDNIIVQNRQVGIYMSGFRPTIRKNIISQNQAGLTIDYDAVPTISENDIDINQNPLVNFMKCGNVISLSNNYWGTTDANALKAKIIMSDNGPNFGIQLEPLATKAFH